MIFFAESPNFFIFVVYINFDLPTDLTSDDYAKTKQKQKQRRRRRRRRQKKTEDPTIEIRYVLFEDLGKVFFSF